MSLVKHKKLLAMLTADVCTVVNQGYMCCFAYKQMLPLREGSQASAFILIMLAYRLSLQFCTGLKLSKQNLCCTQGHEALTPMLFIARPAGRHQSMAGSRTCSSRPSMLLWISELNRETDDSEDNACAGTIQMTTVAGTCLGVVGNMADTPVHVTGGAQHDIGQPAVQFVVAVDQLMRHHKPQSAFCAKAQHKTCSIF